MVRMMVHQYKPQVIEYIMQKATPFFQGIVLSDPPESIEASATVVKDVVNDKVDSIADRIKQEIQRKKGVNN